MAGIDRRLAGMDHIFGNTGVAWASIWQTKLLG
jgi:hypothetical protein